MTYLEPIQSAGFRLYLEDGKLLVEPFSKLTDRQREFLRRHKAELIAELTAAANESTDRLAFRYCSICGDATLHQRINDRWQCVRYDHEADGAPGTPNLKPMDLEDRKGPWVTCYTPSGHPIRIKARDRAHAEWLRKMNPRPRKQS